MSASTIFTGASRYTTDFQSIIDRTVAIASLPLRQLQNQQAVLTSQSQALAGLDASFEALQSALQSLDRALGASSYIASSSDAEAAAASVTAGALEGSYTIAITSLGAYTSTISSDALPPVSDPFSNSISSSGTFTLTVNGKPVVITPTDGSIMGLAKAINGAAVGVQASVVNTGNSGSPNYRLAIRSSTLAADTIQLNDGTNDLLTTLATGSRATYTVNGLPTTIQSDSRTVTLAPGVTVRLLQTTPDGSPVTVTVARSLEDMRSAIGNFAEAYNAVVDKLDQQRGPGAGPLAGHSVVRGLSTVIRHITQYTTASGAGLEGLGLELGRNGKLSFDLSVIEDDAVSVVEQFLGSIATGGFLKAANDAVDSVENADSGSLTDAIDGMNVQLERHQELIAKNEARIDDLRTSLEARMAAADALIASLEQQANYINGLFEAMTYNSRNNR